MKIVEHHTPGTAYQTITNRKWVSIIFSMNELETQINKEILSRSHYFIRFSSKKTLINDNLFYIIKFNKL